MIIGVDARSLSEPLTGIGRYTLKLLEIMVQDEENHWILYSHRPLENGNWDKKNITLRTSNYPRWARILRMIWAQFFLPVKIRSDKIDIFWSPAHRIPMFLDNKVSSVVTIHDLVWKHAPDTMRWLSCFLDSRLMPKAIKKADRVIAVSNSTKEDIIKLDKKLKKKISVISEGCSFEFSQICKNIDQKFILFVGTIEPRKNLYRLLHAYSSLSSDLIKDYRIVIIGGKGWGKQDIYKYAQKLNILNRIELLGYVKDEVLIDYYMKATILAIPSLYEGFGLPIIEAMSAGLPVLTSNNSSMSEIIQDAGVVVDPLDVSSIRDGLEKLLTDEKLRENLSYSGLKRSRDFDWSLSAKKTLEELISSNNQKN